MKLFPHWMKEMGRSEVVIEGVDLQIHDHAEAYRQAVAQIKYDPLSLGALVTTHKLDLFQAASDMFDDYGRNALRCGEVSCISKRDGKLIGLAKDPITCGLSMDDLLGKDYFGRTGGEVLCFGAGGAGIAAALHLASKQNAAGRPRRFTVVDVAQSRLDHLRDMVVMLETDIDFTFELNSNPTKNDALLGKMPAGSLIINATGMGKDIPGSPITDSGHFPENGIAWEFNYRGKLDFMQQALAQQNGRNLTIEDGWLYFLHGWTQVIAEVLHIDLTDELFARLGKVASFVRPPAVVGLRK